MDDDLRIPWTSSARLIEGGGERSQVGTLRGCVRAWSFLEAERQAGVRIECDNAMRLPGWTEPVVFVGPERIAELLLRIGW